MITNLFRTLISLSLLICSSCEFDSGGSILEACGTQEVIVSQTSSNQRLMLDRDHPVAQSFKASCLDGVFSTVTLKLQTVASGVETKVRVELLEQAEDGTTGAHIDEAFIDNITSASLVDYTAVFDYGTKLDAQKTYWLKVFNVTANDTYLATSGGSSAYGDGELFDTVPEWLVNTAHRDIYFTAKVK